jgi:hypothetical protein
MFLEKHGVKLTLIGFLVTFQATLLTLFKI